MNYPARKWMTRSVFAGAALAALATTAMADGYIVREHDYREGQYMGGPPAYAYDSRDEGRHHHCRAPAWNPNQRYMPGDTVRRNGNVYVARGVSGRVYNENSPPEWTPNYWRPVEHC